MYGRHGTETQRVWEFFPDEPEFRRARSSGRLPREADGRSGDAADNGSLDWGPGAHVECRQVQPSRLRDSS